MHTVICPETALRLDALEDLFISTSNRKREAEATRFATTNKGAVLHYQTMSNDIEYYPN